MSFILKTERTVYFINVPHASNIMAGKEWEKEKQSEKEFHKTMMIKMSISRMLSNIIEKWQKYCIFSELTEFTYISSIFSFARNSTCFRECWHMMSIYTHTYICYYLVHIIWTHLVRVWHKIASYPLSNSHTCITSSDEPIHGIVRPFHFIREWYTTTRPLFTHTHTCMPLSRAKPEFYLLGQFTQL